MRLESPAINRFIAEHPNWRYADHALHATFTFATFRDAVEAFMTIARQAEVADHHPDLTNRYTTLTIALTSHDAGGVTERDLELARQINTALAS